MKNTITNFDLDEFMNEIKNLKEEKFLEINNLMNPTEVFEAMVNYQTANPITSDMF